MHEVVRNHFLKCDPVIYKLFMTIGDIDIVPSENHFVDLLESIVSQQLSIKAADTIWGRYTNVLPCHIVTPESVLSLSVETARTAGLSGSKASYIRNVAEAFQNGFVTPEKFPTMTDEEVITQLVQIKGVGRWTAEMFLIFSLGREDVFSMGDLGLRNAINRIYAKGKKPLSDGAIAKMSKRWSPYRSYASRALWKSLDTQNS
jgi:DNA-3-methyladenine glycosylase II